MYIYVYTYSHHICTYIYIYIYTYTHAYLYNLHERNHHDPHEHIATKYPPLVSMRSGSFFERLRRAQRMEGRGAQAFTSWDPGGVRVLGPLQIPRSLPSPTICVFLMLQLHTHDIHTTWRVIHPTQSMMCVTSHCLISRFEQIYLLVVSRVSFSTNIKNLARRIRCSRIRSCAP